MESLRVSQKSLGLSQILWESISGLWEYLNACKSLWEYLRVSLESLGVSVSLSDTLENLWQSLRDLHSLSGVSKDSLIVSRSLS